MMSSNKNNLICDIETGVCGVSDDNEMELIDFSKPSKKIDFYYVTDPICSHCWALEPALRRFIKQYGHYLNFITVMGGLLEKWHGGPVDPANGIYGPADVAGHWREVGAYYRMPIDGSLMIDNPVQSSFPPSRVYKIIQKQHGEQKAFEYLRRAREDLFAFNKNIGEAAVLIEIVTELGLDGEQIVTEANGPTGQKLLHEDFALTRNLGARGFPTIIMANVEKKGIKIVGNRSFKHYLDGLRQVLGKEPIGQQQPALSTLLEEERLLFSKEIEVMYDLEQADVQRFVKDELANIPFEQKELLGETYFTLAK